MLGEFDVETKVGLSKFIVENQRALKVLGHCRSWKAILMLTIDYNKNGVIKTVKACC